MDFGKPWNASSKVVMIYFILHVTCPSQAAVTYKFLAALFGVSYNLTNKKALKNLGEKLMAKKLRLNKSVRY